MTVKSAEIKAGKRNAIEVSTREQTFYMYADSEKEKDEWIGGKFPQQQQQYLYFKVFSPFLFCVHLNEFKI